MSIDLIAKDFRRSVHEQYGKSTLDDLLVILSIAYGTKNTDLIDAAFGIACAFYDFSGHRFLYKDFFMAIKRIELQ